MIMNRHFINVAVSLICFSLIIMSCSRTLKSEFEDCYSNKISPIELLQTSTVKKYIVNNYSQQYYDKLLKNADVFSPVYYDSILNSYRVYVWKNEKYNISDNAQLRYYIHNDSLATTLVVNNLEIDKSGDSDYDMGKIFAKKGLKEVERKAKQGRATAQYVLAQYYTPSEIATAIDYYTKAAEQSNSQALYTLGNLVDFSYEFGSNEQNLPYIIKAANCGHALSKFQLWISYLYGKDVIQNESQALYWLKTYAEQSLIGIVELGKIYAGKNDRIVYKDDKKALMYFTQAAKENSEEAYYWLGEILSTSNQISRDYSKSLKYFQKSASLGYTNSQIKLGVAYCLGNTGLVHKDIEQSLKYFHNAAEQDNITAQYAICIILFNKAKLSNISNEELQELKKWYKELKKQVSVYGEKNFNKKIDNEVIDKIEQSLTTM